jgi:hypothetical protein
MTSSEFLRSRESELQRHVSSIRARRERFEEDHAIALQVEASLIELANENQSNIRSLDQQELQVKERRLAFERRLDETSNALNQAEESLRSERERQDLFADEIDDGWRAVEEELRSIDACHSYEVQKLKKMQRELEEREAMIRERMRSSAEREQVLQAEQRQLKSREALFREINRTSFDRRISELHERETMLHNEELI